MTTDHPGRELPKGYREVAKHLVNHQGWRYRHRGRHAILYPADPTKDPIIVPTTPSDRRGFDNFIAEIRRAGGIWPPRKR